MSQFLYFIPGMPRNRIPRDEVLATFAKDALWDLLRSDKTWSGTSAVFNMLHQDGPGGKVGTIFACLPGGMAIDGFATDYRPAEQTWVEIDGAWLGWYTDNPPTEESLRKPSQISGYPVTLNDDSAWTAPVIRCQPAGSRVTLPQSLGLGTGGTRIVRIKPQYQRWQDLVAKLWGYKFSGEGASLSDLCDDAAILLSLNYRIGPREIDALGLFELLENGGDSVPNWFHVIDASYDWPLIQELMDEETAKKKESAPTDSEQSAGSGDETKPAAA